MENAPSIREYYMQQRQREQSYSGDFSRHDLSSEDIRPPQFRRISEQEQIHGRLADQMMGHVKDDAKFFGVAMSDAQARRIAHQAINASILGDIPLYMALSRATTAYVFEQKQREHKTPLTAEQLDALRHSIEEALLERAQARLGLLRESERRWLEAQRTRDNEQREQNERLTEPFSVYWKETYGLKVSARYLSSTERGDLKQLNRPIEREGSVEEFLGFDDTLLIKLPVWGVEKIRHHKARIAA